jgi:hypothetical protein
MTDHRLDHEISRGKTRDGVTKGCVRVVCACGFQGVWMTPTLPDANGEERPTIEFVPVLMEQLRAAGHNDIDPADAEEELYQRVLARLKKEGHI